MCSHRSILRTLAGLITAGLLAVPLLTAAGCGGAESGPHASRLRADSMVAPLPHGGIEQPEPAAYLEHMPSDAP